MAIYGNPGASSLGNGLIGWRSVSQDSVNGIKNYDNVQDFEALRLAQKAKLDAQEAAKQRDWQAQQNEANRQVQLAPLNYKMQLFDRLYPNLQGMLGQNGTFGMVGGQVSPQPAFTPSPVYTPDQINQQVNAAVAANDRRYQTAGRQLDTSNAIRGFGAFSPMSQALHQSLSMGNIGENARAEREIPFQAAQSNSDAMFRGNQLLQSMWQSREDSDIRRRQAQLTGLNSIISLLS